MPYTARELAALLEGEVVGDGDTSLTGFAPADTAQAGDLTFAETEAYFARAEQSAAAAVLVDTPLRSEKKVLIRVRNARIAFAKVLPLFFPEAAFAPGIHASAVVAGTAQVDPSAHVGPLCVIGERARLGPRAVLVGGVHVGEDCEIGADVRLFPHVTLYPRSRIGDRVRIHAGAVIGADGFGYVLDAGRHRKIPQVGHVIIEEDVEIGANVTIDRGALGPTILGKGTKLDNLVQVGHNVVVGEHCLLIAQVGIAGSTRLGNYVTLAGQAGIAGHLEIGHQAVVAAQSGVMNNIPAGEKWLGAPARPAQQFKRQFIALEHLPRLLKRVTALEEKLGRASSQPAEPPTPEQEPPGGG